MVLLVKHPITCLTYLTLTDKDEFGFVENNLICSFAAQVSFNGIETLFISRGEFGVEGVIVEIECY